MKTSKILEKQKQLKPSQDYSFLRQEGIQHLQNLSGSIWTDHNSHDPGITILEILCYAITDLGYRTDFLTQDLLTNKSGMEPDPQLSTFFPAQDVLTNTPLTIMDYRKILLKIKGVRNAWLVPLGVQEAYENEVPVFVDTTQKSLSYEENNHKGVANESLNLSGLYKVLLEFEVDEKVNSPKIIKKAKCILNAHRNLCEDFFQIETVPTEPFGICMDIEVKNQADLEKVQAEVFFEIEKYFNPPVKYYSLKELLEEGMSSDEIFNGPWFDYQFECDGELVFTKPGFIKSNDLQESELRKEIYSSDIINLLMDLENVVSIKNLQLQRYDHAGNPIDISHRWSINVSDQHQPIFDVSHSKVLFFKNEIPFLAQPEEFENTLNQLRVKAKKALYMDSDQTLEIPRGTYRDTSTHFSIQHDFPQTYQIGEEGLGKNARPERIIQARQLKGYLTFFDQILADYLQQLGNLSKLFSLDKNINQTYFSSFLTKIASSEKNFEEEYYLDPAKLSDPKFRNLLTEDEVIFQDRKNRLLDHLISRFSEQFTDYVLMMHTLKRDTVKTNSLIIEDKIEFLKEYPVISRERNKAFNLYPQKDSGVWDTDNVSGLEKRITRLTGIPSYNRTNLSCENVFSKVFKVQKSANKFHVTVKDRNNEVIFKSVQKFNSKEDALKTIDNLSQSLHDASNFSIAEKEGSKKYIFSISENDSTLQSDKTYDSPSDALADIQKIVNQYDDFLESSACDKEGFYLFEHILFRPRKKGDPLMNIFLDDESDSCGDEDPYSFRITVVLPYWPERFQNMQFRQFFEKTVREQTPAHIHVKICWISNEQMETLQSNYHLWLQTHFNNEANTENGKISLYALLETIEQLKTIYPKATLHDCIDDDTNPVRLGSTNLGVF